VTPRNIDAAPLVLLRVVPVRTAVRQTSVIVERSITLALRNWAAILSGFFEPLFYLAAFGLGVGSAIPSVDLGNDTVSYVVFLAPGLLAVSAMNGAVYDSTFNVFFKMRFQRLYDGMLSTSLAVWQVATGEIVWSLIRGVLYGAGFLAVMLAFGLVSSWWAVLALPAVALIALAFASLGMALTTFITSFQHLDWVQAALLPMFLFSGAFSPVTTYPEAVQPVIEALPLYHGVELLRALTVGSVGSSTLWDVIYLAALGVAGLLMTSVRLERLLRR